MNQEKMQSIALMRYSAIAPLISGTGNYYASYDAFFVRSLIREFFIPTDI